MLKTSAYCCIIVAVLLLATCIPEINGRPHRQKRVSDQRLAELETLLALAKMRGKLVTVPVGFGRFDFKKIGRRRRRSPIKHTPQEELQLDLEQILADREQALLEQDDDIQSSGDAEERSGSSAQYEDLLRQYLLAWAKEENLIASNNKV